MTDAITVEITALGGAHIVVDVRVTASAVPEYRGRRWSDAEPAEGIEWEWAGEPAIVLDLGGRDTVEVPAPMLMQDAVFASLVERELEMEGDR